MRMRKSTAALLIAVWMTPAIARGQGRPMTLADVLTRARAQAPQIVSARLTLEETRARLLGASLRFQNNPELDIGVGNRQGTDTRFTDFEIGLGQTLEPGSRRSARMVGATAALTQGSADIEEVTRLVLRSAAAAYLRAVHAQARLRLLTGAQELASGVYSVADRRFRAGDIAVLDVNIARASLARVRADQQATEAARTEALGNLRALLRIDEDIMVQGELTRTDDVDLSALLQAAAQRPELRALQAGVQEAEADIQLGRTFRRPDYGLGVRYSREEGDQIVLGGLTITLPAFTQGQQLQAAGAARAGRLRAELEAAQSRVRLEVRSAFDAYSQRLAAVRVLETDALPGLDDNESLTTRSFEVGQIGLPELLLIRREILDTRFQHLDALLEAALARLELDARAAILR